ncbi:glycosyltransferase family 4 protein [Roseibacillus persicicus]|uniref:glycosyltransferase family 4 protein n=1 Tax=Roseibacillus persicicus TaxID=454148 RepID=UPI00280F30A1|nr:glycosyltransferase family 4 protein [Roseibacillus persicicus]MDQ8189145.1 glycosyltransferase family 4 protein [Roseibacillus persicicus]
MKILVHDYAGHPFQVQLSRELASRGHHVRHAYAGGLQTPRGELQKRESDPDSFDSFEVPMSPDYAKFKYSFIKRRAMEIEYGQSAAKMIREWKPELVISANTPTESQTGVLAGSQAVGAKFVYWCQDFYSIAVDKLVRKKIPVLGGLIGNYYKGLDRKHLQASDHVVAITEDFKPIMVDEFGVAADKVTVIPNWAPLENLPVEPKDNAWAAEQNLTGKFVVLYTGTLGMKHNPNLLLGVAERFKDNDEVRVVVISEGMGSDWLKEQKEAKGLSNLILLGYQPFDKLPQVLASGDVLTGVLEEDAGVFSVPSKVLTYLCAKKPILLAVPEVNLAARIIREEEAGLTVGPADEAGFWDAAEKLYNDRPMADAMAERARSYAEKTFDVKLIGNRFEDLMKQLEK